MTTSTVYRHTIRMHFDDHAPDALAGDKGTPVAGPFESASSALRELELISASARAAGSTIQSECHSPYILFVTTRSGERITYRTWQV
ncbi:Uncharacterised protein [Mycobacteroides abscessus subsp. abscessus]|nr:Uncharacterised protein [Mycobacteroides abscessus subsp. abscessus]